MSRSIARRPPRVLLVNDDGPPHFSSPHILPLYTALVNQAGWDVTVVLPSGQRSWGSMAFTIRGHLPVWYYYPLRNNHTGSAEGTAECWSSTRRPINRERGEVAEWVLIDGSPTTATNVGLFNTDVLLGAESHPVRRNAAAPASGEVAQPPPFSSWADLVISGPNFGRNTGTAFALSSGTLGAALSGALAGVKSIAISYGHFQGDSGPKLPSKSAFQGAADANSAVGGSSSSSAATANPANTTEPVKTDADAGHIVKSPPPPEHIEQLATNLTVRIVKRLWEEWEDGVQCYSLNVPLAWTLQEPTIYWTKMWENQYPRLFKQISAEEVEANPSKKVLSEHDGARPTPSTYLTFAPPMGCMLAPEQLPQGTDIWALMNGWVSVVRLTAKYSHVDASSTPSLEQAWTDASPATTPPSAPAAPPSRPGPGTRWML